MAANDWNEIKRLAADFQRAQLSSTSHKLSERNCIEVVNKLINLGLIEVFHTTDGKEYLTPNQLEREIRDELIVHGGRINLVDLQQITRVDFLHVESKVNEIIHKDRFLSLVNGELLDKDYLDRIAEEIDETLQEAGQVAISELAKSFDLPTDFIFSVIEPRLDVIIHGQLDPINHNILFTAAFIARNIAKIRGICSGLMRPTQVIQLAVQYGLSEKLFLNVLETLLSTHRLSGTIQGGKEKATYIPEIYSKTLTDYVDTFFKQNSYIEYQTLSRLGISDSRQYLKKRYSDADYIYLSSCCASNVIVDQIDAGIEEALINDYWVDVNALVPTPFTNEDINQVLQRCMKGASRASTIIFCEHIVASKKFVDKCKSIFDPLMKTKATNDVKMSPSLFAELTRKEKTALTESGTGDGKQSRKDERQKKAMAGGGQKGGGGRGSRESGTKKTKNKYRNRKDEDEENFNEKSSAKQELSFMSKREVEEVLETKMEDADMDFVDELSSYLSKILSREYQEIAKSIFINNSLTSASGKRKSTQDHREKINGLLTNIKLFEKGLNLFEGDVHILLCKYLLKTVATDIVNIIFEIVAHENLMSLSNDEVFSFESRLKLLKKLPDQWKVPLTKLNSSLTGKNLGEFYTNMELVSSPEYCDIVQKKVDKKKERQILFNHRQSLMDQLDREIEPAMALHLASLILFQYHTNTLLHAPGRCVPHIIGYLQSRVAPKDYETLSSYQNLVIQQLSDKGHGGDSAVDTNAEGGGEEGDVQKKDMRKAVSILLSGGLSDIKDIVKNMKKSHEE